MKENLERLKELSSWMFLTSGIPIHFYYKNKLISNSYHYNFYQKLSELTLPALSSSFDCKLIWFDEENSNIMYGLLQPDNSCTLLAGPCCLQKLSPSELRHYAKQHHLKNFILPESSVTRLEGLLLLLSACFHSSSSNVQILNSPVSTSNEETISVPSWQMQQYQLDRTEIDFSHHSYEAELLMRQCFIDGNEKAFHQLQKNFTNESTGTMSYNSIKQAEYAAAISVSFYVRHAIDAGVDQLTAYNINDLYLQKISRETSPLVFGKLMNNCAHTLMQEIKKVKAQQNELPYIQNCKQYIYRHLNKVFTLNDIAEYVNLSPNYLSSLFKTYENISIKEYTLKKRIDASQNMLKYSDYTISQISYYFCFCTQSHFTEIFKKYTGETPSSYRKKNKKNKPHDYSW